MQPRNAREDKKGRSLKAYFTSLFDRRNARNKEQFVNFCKWLMFIVVLVVEAFIVLVLLNGFFIKEDLWTLVFVLALEGLLTVSQAFKLFVVKGRVRILFYILDAACACGFSFLAEEPRGFRVKKAKVLAPIDCAVRTIAILPAEDDR